MIDTLLPVVSGRGRGLASSDFPRRTVLRADFRGHHPFHVLHSSAGRSLLARMGILAGTGRRSPSAFVLPSCLTKHVKRVIWLALLARNLRAMRVRL